MDFVLVFWRLQKVSPPLEKSRMALLYNTTPFPTVNSEVAIMHGCMAATIHDRALAASQELLWEQMGFLKHRSPV
jgi:hypothetical protein